MFACFKLYYFMGESITARLLTLNIPFAVVLFIQLDCRSGICPQKINLPTNQKGYGNFETTVGKLSARRIQIRCDYFCSGIILKDILNNFQNNAYTKIVMADLDSPRRIL